MFKLNWKFNNPTAVTTAVRAIRIWMRLNSNNHNDYRVKDIIKQMYPNFYDNLTRGDKCRVGRAFSYLYNWGYFPEFGRGKKKGSTNTYHMI